MVYHVHGLNATTTFNYGFNNDAYNNTRAYEKVTLPEGNISYTYKDAKGRVTSTKQVNQNSGEILNTKYTYNVIGELLTVTDAEDKQTKYQYDLFGQKKSVLHPDNGTTVFEYDLAGKLISHANQNLINAGQEIKYEYEFNRLTTIYYPSHKVTYIYGGTSGSNEQYSLGRIARVVDLTGNKRVSYGALGEVLFEARDVQSNVGSMVFETRFRYDSWGRILEMQYPDGEQLRYTYNSTGQLKAIFNDKGESYLKDVEYNFFDQPTKILYGNGVVTTNEYDITQRIRAMQLDRPDTTSFLRNLYSYDRNQNITEINNESSQHNTIRLGGVYNKTYTYDAFNRLATANGSWTGFEEAHNYSLDLRYSATHGIKRKAQFHEASDLVTSHETPHSYRSDYEYDDIDHPHAVSTIHYSNHNNQPKGKATFKYDDNGNMKFYHSDVEDAFMKREFIWDEQNRLMAVIDFGEKISHYVYDHAGERTFKSEGYVSQVNIAGQQIYTAANFDEYIIYPSGYLVVNPSKNEYSKHYYINGKRFVSRLDKMENLMSGNLVAETDPIKTESELIRDLKTAESIDLTNSVLSFVPDNTDANCTAQLNALIANYTANNNPPFASLQHCIDILNGYKNTLPPCEALVKANEYICEPVDLTSPGNIPIITLPPNYNEDELEQFDCLTVLNTILAEYSGLMVNVLDEYPETIRNIYICVRACASNPAGATNCVLDFEQTGVWSEACIELLRDCGCMPPGYDCYREVVLYIQNNLVLEPVSNACEVLQYVLNNFDCAPAIIVPIDPEAPGDIEDDWDDEGGNDGIPQEDYDEAQRKPIWWYHTDHLGSSTYLTDNFGRPSHYYETLPFGEMMVEHNQSANVPSGMGYDNKYKFNGKELDDATGMYYYGARYYDPRISIFVSVDPLAEQTFEPYLYTGNNPIMFTDPTGMSKEQEGGGWWSKMKSFLGMGSSNKQEASPIPDTELDEITVSANRKPSWFQRNKDNLIKFISDFGGGSQIMDTHRQAMDGAIRSDGSVNWTSYSAHTLWLDKINNYGGDMGSAATPTQSRTPKSIHWEGKTFSQYKAAYWATRTKTTYQPIRMSNGKVFNVYTELHHRFVPQRARWAPNWLKNNRFNLEPLNTIQHGISDPYRFQFFPKEIKQSINNGNTFGY